MTALTIPTMMDRKHWRRNRILYPFRVALSWLSGTWQSGRKANEEAERTAHVQTDDSAQDHEIFPVFWPHYQEEPRYHCKRTGEFFTESNGKYTLITRSI